MQLKTYYAVNVSHVVGGITTTRVLAPLEVVLHELGQLIDYNCKPDGNCLFRALSMLLHGTEDRWDEVKAQILSYAATRPDWLMQFFDNSISADNDADDRTFVKFLRDLGTANAWGGEHCIGIACRLFKINIWTFSHAHWEIQAHRDPVDNRQKSTSTWVDNALVGGDVAASDVPFTPKLKSMPFPWTAVQKQILLDCYRDAGGVCKGEALKLKMLELFQAHYPNFQQTAGTLLKRYFDFSKERERISISCPQFRLRSQQTLTTLRRKKSVAKFEWTDESKQCLSGLVAEMTATVPRNGKVWPEVLRRFRSFYPECALADNSIRIRFYDIKKGAQFSTGDNTVLLWQPDINTFLIDCAQRADAEDRLNRTLLMSKEGPRPRELPQTGGLFFPTKYPDFTANQERRRVATFQTDQPLEDEETLESTVPIEQHYDAAYLADARRSEYLPKLVSHYMDMFAIMFEKEPAAVSENVQAGDKRKMTQSAVDQLTIKNALRFLREHNHLFKSLYAQCETLYRFVPNEGVQSIKIVGGYVSRPADLKKSAADVIGDAEEMVLLAPHGEIAAADHPMDEVNYGIVHPKNSGVPDMGTGGFYKKTAAAAGWSRRDYVNIRLLMLHPAFRVRPAWIFYQTDQLIKEQILNYNMNTVKVADLVNLCPKKT
ncbi:hypothetical protein BV898_19137 [Hypsibius exemplaris]|uniref:OTU domain-containing protein n=1 Tax=Hypsibius exemplaris TaxID=2072580 RepID=A0A9X6NIZ2_HYPEX|nr:hypothetical protein BV898_19137 [Hypsibius exemplaris]